MNGSFAETGAPVLSKRPLRRPPLSSVLYKLYTIGGLSDVQPLIETVNFVPTVPESGVRITFPLAGGALVVN